MWLSAVVLCVLMGLYVTQSYNQASLKDPTYRHPLNDFKAQDQIDQLTANIERLQENQRMIVNKLRILKVSSNRNKIFIDQFATLSNEVNNEITEQNRRFDYLDAQASRISDRLKQVLLRGCENSRMIDSLKLRLAQISNRLDYSTAIATEVNVQVDSQGFGTATLKYPGAPIKPAIFVTGFQYFPNKRPLFLTHGKGFKLETNYYVDLNHEQFGTMNVSVNFTPLEIALTVLGINFWK